jgi:hypothetical protein
MICCFSLVTWISRESERPASLLLGKYQLCCHLWQLLLSEKSTWNLEHEQIEDLTMPSGRLHMKRNGEHRYTWNPSQEAGRKLSTKLCMNKRQGQKTGRRNRKLSLTIDDGHVCSFLTYVCRCACTRKQLQNWQQECLRIDGRKQIGFLSYINLVWPGCWIPKSSQYTWIKFQEATQVAMW